MAGHGLRQIVVSGIAALALATGLIGTMFLFNDARPADAKNGQVLSVRFGELQSCALPGPSCPGHFTIDNPGPIDKKSTVTFDMKTNAFHQVIIMEAGVQVSDIAIPGDPDGAGPLPAPTYIFSGSGPENPLPPLDAGWLVPGSDPLPPGVLAVGVTRQDFSFEFQKKGTYVVICNVRSHFANGMWIELEVENINLNNP